MREKYERELTNLQTRINLMGNACEEEFRDLIRAFKNNDRTAYAAIAASDDDVDHYEQEIEAICLSLILHQQPVASDLRLVSSCFKLITDLERIGDQLCDISQLLLTLHNDKGENFTLLEEMLDCAFIMLTDSLDAFARRDLKLAKKVIEADDKVDGMFLTLRGKLEKDLHLNSAEAHVELDELMIAKYIERIADHACNAAQWAVFAVTGKHISGAVI